MWIYSSLRYYRCSGKWVPCVPWTPRGHHLRWSRCSLLSLAVFINNVTNVYYLYHKPLQNSKIFDLSLNLNYVNSFIAKNKNIIYYVKVKLVAIYMYCALLFHFLSLGKNRKTSTFFSIPKATKLTSKLFFGMLTLGHICCSFVFATFCLIQGWRVKSTV